MTSHDLASRLGHPDAETAAGRDSLLSPASPPASPPGTAVDKARTPQGGHVDDDHLSPHEWLTRGIAADEQRRQAAAAAAGDPEAIRRATVAEVDDLFRPEPEPSSFDHGTRSSAPAPEPEPGFDRIRRAIAEGGAE